MREAAQLPPLDRVVHRGAAVTIGKWRCPAGRPDFRDTGPIERHVVAFPRTSVRIRNAGSAAFVCDASVFTMYNAGQRYTREAVHPEGDVCDWWAVDADTARSIARELDARAPHDTDRPFRFENGTTAASLYLEQRWTLHALEARAIDDLEAEERALAIVARALASAVRSDGARAPKGRPAHRDLAQDAIALLGARFHERLTLGGCATALGVSPFHLCRVFREQTGGPLHRHLLRLRVRASLQGIAASRRDLSGIALDAGFSSHSHFTAAFVREFGVSPSCWRSRSGRSSPRERYLRRV